MQSFHFSLLGIVPKPLSELGQSSRVTWHETVLFWPLQINFLPKCILEGYYKNWPCCMDCFGIESFKCFFPHSFVAHPLHLLTEMEWISWLVWEKDWAGIARPLPPFMLEARWPWDVHSSLLLQALRFTRADPNKELPVPFHCLWLGG